MGSTSVRIADLILSEAGWNKSMSSKKIYETENYDRVFKRIDFSDSQIQDIKFNNCEFIDCEFSEATLNGSRFVDCLFKGCNLSLIKIRGASFANTTFEESKVIGVNWTEASWPTIELSSPIHFFKSVLDNSIFFGINLREIRITKSSAVDVDFRECNLTKADFSHTDFAQALFMNTNLFQANFVESTNYAIDISNNNVGKARFSLPDAVALLKEIDICVVDETGNDIL